MKFYVVTRGTTDFGHRCVARAMVIVDGAIFHTMKPLEVNVDIEVVRGAILTKEPTWVRVPPHPDDDPVIVESWGSPEDAAALLAIQGQR